jgi:cytochrome bd-type quinol oxidase subunit 2
LQENPRIEANTSSTSHKNLKKHICCFVFCLEEVENLGDWKTELSVLWLMNAFSIMTLVLLNLFETGDLTHMMPPIAVDSWSLLLVSVVIIVVLAMAFLSQVLADNMNRWLNIIVGAVYSIAALAATVLSLTSEPSVLAINSATGFLWTALVVWIAWKSK